MVALSIAVVGPNAQPLLGAAASGQTPATITVINLDTENTVNLGSAANQLALPLGPLASLTMTAPVWAAAATETLQVGLVPGGSNYSPGALTITGPVTAEITGTVEVSGTVEIAAGEVTFTNDTIDVVGAGGTFPPGGNDPLLSNASGTAAAGAGFATALMDGLAYNSYNMQVGAYCSTQSTAGSPIVAFVQILWFADAAGTVLLYSDAWWTWVADNSAAIATAVGSGPMHGRYMQVIIWHFGTASTLVIANLTVYGTGRSLEKPVWRQGIPPMSAASGFTQLAALPNATVAGTDDVLAALNSDALAASTKYFLPMPLSAGPIYIRFETTQTLGADFVVCAASNLANGMVGTGAANNPNVLLNAASTALTDYETSIVAPHAPLFAVIDAGTSAPTVSLMVTSQDAG